MDHCSKPLKAESQARALKAEAEGNLDALYGQLYCECGEPVGAVRKPYLDGPNGGSLRTTSHYPHTPPKPYRSGKRGPSKSSGL